MKKTLKKIFSFISSAAVLMTCSTSVFSWAEIDEYYYPPAFLDEYTYIDDKGMFAEEDYYKVEGYKYIYYDTSLYRADPIWSQFIFILDDNINKDEVNDKIHKIFRGFFPEEDYAQAEYMPQIFETTYHGKDAYECYFASRMFDITSPNDERIVEARKSSKEMMKKLYDEKLIVAFYDFGETYDIKQHTPGVDWIRYNDGADIVEQYIVENDIDCDIERKGENACELLFADDVKLPERLEIAADIYEATSIKCSLWGSYDFAYTTRFGKNALENLSSDTTVTGPTIDFSTATIAGDLDLNDEQGISDIVALTKYTASPELYPITDPTALANADINKDGTIDSVDTSILVEIMLGTYESAV